MELGTLPAERRLSEEDVAEIRAIGDNTGSMALKGASPAHEGEERPDRWPLSEELAAAGRRWGVDPERDLAGVASRSPLTMLDKGHPDLSTRISPDRIPERYLPS